MIYRLTMLDASVFVGIRRYFKREGKRRGESTKEKKASGLWGLQGEREIEREREKD